MNLPNQLTLHRLLLTAIFVGVMSIDIPYRSTIGLLLFIAAALTDFLDGYLARKLNLITNFGKLMDPLADKVLMCAGFVILTELGHMPAWVVIAILAREFLVTGLRLVASAQGLVVAADKLGKQKTIWQIVVLIYFLVWLASAEGPLFGWMSGLFEWTPTSPAITGNVLIAIALILTVWSGVGYMLKNKHVLSEN